MKIYANLGQKIQAQKNAQKKVRKIANEQKLQEITKKVARSILDTTKKVTVSKTGDITEFSVEKIIQEYDGKMELVDNIWAPWSKSYKK